MLSVGPADRLLLVVTVLAILRLRERVSAPPWPILGWPRAFAVLILATAIPNGADAVTSAGKVVELRRTHARGSRLSRPRLASDAAARRARRLLHGRRGSGVSSVPAQRARGGRRPSSASTTSPPLGTLASSSGWRPASTRGRAGLRLAVVAIWSRARSRSCSARRSRACSASISQRSPQSWRWPPRSAQLRPVRRRSPRSASCVRRDGRDASRSAAATSASSKSGSARSRRRPASTRRAGASA